MRVLFVCSRARLRSATAARHFATRGHETDFAGLAPDADVPLEPEQLEWAELVCVMERAHERKLTRDFGRWLRDKRVVCLGIADEYTFMQPELVELLERKMAALA